MQNKSQNFAFPLTIDITSQRHKHIESIIQPYMAKTFIISKEASKSEQGKKYFLDLLSIIKSLGSWYLKYRDIYYKIMPILTKAQVIPKISDIEKELPTLLPVLEKKLNQNMIQKGQLITTYSLLQQILTRFQPQQLANKIISSPLSLPQQKSITEVVKLQQNLLKMTEKIQQNNTPSILHILEKVREKGAYSILQTQYEQISNEDDRQKIITFVKQLQENTIQLHRQNRITDFIKSLNNRNSQIRDVQYSYRALKTHHQSFLQPVYNLFLAYLEDKTKNKTSSISQFFNNKHKNTAQQLQKENERLNSEVQTYKQQIQILRNTTKNISSLFKNMSEMPHMPLRPVHMLKSTFAQTITKIVHFQSIQNQPLLNEELLNIEKYIKSVLSQLSNTKTQLQSASSNYKNLRKQNEQRQRSSMILQDEYDNQQIQGLNKIIQHLKKQNQEKDKITKTYQQIMLNRDENDVQNFKEKYQKQQRQNKNLRANQKKMRENYAQLQNQYRLIQQNNSKLLKEQSYKIQELKKELLSLKQQKQRQGEDKLRQEELHLKYIQLESLKNEQIIRLKELLADKQLILNTLTDKYKQIIAKKQSSIASLKIQQIQLQKTINELSVNHSTNKSITTPLQAKYAQKQRYSE